MGCGSVLELTQPDLCVIRLCARPAAIGQLGRSEKSGRIAPDELLLLAPSREAERVLAELSAELERLDPTGIVLDHSDAFVLTTFSDQAREALARLTPIPIPADGFVQGPVAGVPCKVFATPDELLLLAPSTYAHHVRERILTACADLDVRERVVSDTTSLAQATTA
jgi:hypothetical protein